MGNKAIARKKIKLREQFLKKIRAIKLDIVSSKGDAQDSEDVGLRAVGRKMDESKDAISIAKRDAFTAARNKLAAAVATKGKALAAAAVTTARNKSANGMATAVV